MAVKTEPLQKHPKDKVFRYNGVMSHVLLFSVGKNRMAMDVQDVSHVLRKPRVSPLPGSPDFLEGVLVYREHVVPVIDLGSRLDLVSDSTSARVFLAQVGDMLMGFRVDHIHDVVQVDREQLQSVDDDVPLAGTFMLDDEPISILDTERILTAEQKKILHAIY